MVPSAPLTPGLAKGRAPCAARVIRLGDPAPDLQFDQTLLCQIQPHSPRSAGDPLLKTILSSVRTARPPHESPAPMEGEDGGGAGAPASTRASATRPAEAVTVAQAGAWLAGWHFNRPAVELFRTSKRGLSMAPKAGRTVSLVSKLYGPRPKRAPGNQINPFYCRSRNIIPGSAHERKAAAEESQTTLAPIDFLAGGLDQERTAVWIRNERRQISLYCQERTAADPNAPPFLATCTPRGAVIEGLLEDKHALRAVARVAAHGQGRRRRRRWRPPPPPTLAERGGEQQVLLRSTRRRRPDGE